MKKKKRKLIQRVLVVLKIRIYALVKPNWIGFQSISSSCNKQDKTSLSKAREKLISKSSNKDSNSMSSDLKLARHLRKSWRLRILKKKWEKIWVTKSIW